MDGRMVLSLRCEECRTEIRANEKRRQKGKQTRAHFFFLSTTERKRRTLAGIKQTLVHTKWIRFVRRSRVRVGAVVVVLVVVQIKYLFHLSSFTLFQLNSRSIFFFAGRSRCITNESTTHRHRTHRTLCVYGELVTKQWSRSKLLLGF